MRVVVTGAGGFIGGHLVARLVSNGHNVVACDIKPMSRWHQVSPDARSFSDDVSSRVGALRAMAGCDAVFNLAANMGGMGFIESHRLDCMLNVLSTVMPLIAARDTGVPTLVYASSACVYRADRQVAGLGDYRLKESDAHPAAPEIGYGEEKLFGERLCHHFSQETGLKTGVVRLHNVFGSHTEWRGGREKAPAAICRKVAEAKLSGKHEIEIWGSGNQLRSFMFIDDCVEGLIRIMGLATKASVGPVNLGSEEMVSINQLVDIAEAVAFGRSGVLRRTHKLDAPKGVDGRCSDNTMLRGLLGWEPSIKLADGMSRTYAWIERRIRDAQGGASR